MFTSRAEYRLMLREDNADQRLTARGRELGLVDDARYAAYVEKQQTLEREHHRLKTTWLRPGDIPEDLAIEILGGIITREYKLIDLLRRPGVSYDTLSRIPGATPNDIDVAVATQIEIQAKYSGYIDRQQDEIERHRKHDELILPEDLDYAAVHGLSAEVQQKLAFFRPTTLGQATRISGITPAAISLLLVHLKKRADMSRKSA